MLTFKISRPLFIAAVGRALGIARRAKKTMPVINDTILLTARADGVVVVSATDLDITITSEVGAQVEAPGRALPNASALFEALRLLNGDFVRVHWSAEIGGQSTMLTLRDAGADLDVVCQSADGYPTLPDESAVRFVEADGGALASALRAVQFSTSSDESRPNLCGVFLTGADGALAAVSTDGHRLSREVAELSKAAIDELSGLLMPTAGVVELVRAQGEVGITSVGRLDNNLVFRSDTDAASVVLFVRLVDSNFPDYRLVLPKPHPDTRVATMDRARLTQALARMKIAAHGDKLGVVLEFGPGQLTMRAENVDRGRAVDVVPCDWTADPMKVSVNSRYLSEAVGSLAGDKITFRINEALSPVQLHSGEATDTYGKRLPPPESLRIIMPMRG